MTNKSIVSAVRGAYVLGFDTDGITSEFGELCGCESKPIWHTGVLFYYVTCRCYIFIP